MAEKFAFSETFLKAIFYGQPGSGKTTLCATAMDYESMKPVLWLNAFGNPQVLRKREVLPDIVTVQKMTDFNEPFEWLSEGQDPKHSFCKEFGLKPPYKTLVVDGLTEVQRFVVRAVSGIEFTPPGNLAPALSRQGFGTLLGTMLNWAVNFIALDMNVLLTSLEAQKTDGGIIKREPLLWGQSGGEMCGYVLMVARIVRRLALPKPIEVDLQTNCYNVALFSESTHTYAKDQYGTGLDIMEEPTLPKVMALIEQGA